jgi:hypothetical protein
VALICEFGHMRGLGYRHSPHSRMGRWANWIRRWVINGAISLEHPVSRCLQHAAAPNPEPARANTNGGLFNGVSKNRMRRNKRFNDGATPVILLPSGDACSVKLSDSEQIEGRRRWSRRDDCRVKSSP